MLETIKKLMVKYWDILAYLIFGVLTTAVNYIVYFPLLNIFGLPAAVSNTVGWVAAVAFAYLTNKPFVFKSHDWSAKTVIPELTKFVSCRVASLLAENVILLLAVDILHRNGNVWKIITSVLVVVMNYVASKLLIFKK